MVTIENLWDELISHQGEIFYTAKGLPFTYTIKGGEFFSDRKRKSITRATFERSFLKIQEDKENKITGPKSLNVFGAPYIYATFRQLGVVPKPTSRPKAGGHKKV
ncbi:MAG: hypothetical protein HFG61_05810 [Lachnospiraceae bacterium]|nr:hypothetical protein [Lachnospiraceae bacterium]